MPTQNVMAICSFSYAISFCYYWFSGYVSNSYTKVVNDKIYNFPGPPLGILVVLYLPTLRYDLFFNLYLLTLLLTYINKHYLVDFGYPLRSNYLVPYNRERCHLAQSRVGELGYQKVFN